MVERQLTDRASCAYIEIRRRILDGLSGVLSEQMLARDLEVSRTPVREALKRLESEGLVHSVPRRGTFVFELTAYDIVEIYQVRIALEGLAAQLSATRMADEVIDVLRHELMDARKLAATGREPSAYASDIGFHRRIIAATRNARLATILATLDDQVHRIRTLAFRNPGRLMSTLDEHERVLDAIARHDAMAAQQAMVVHLQTACSNALAMMAPAPPAPDLILDVIPQSGESRP